MKKWKATFGGLVMIAVQLAGVLAQEPVQLWYGYGYATAYRAPVVGEVLINEFMSRPLPDMPEWIELFNTSTTSLQLSGCSLHDAKGVIFSFSEQSLILPSGFWLVELSASKLNNAGDHIEFRCAQELLDSLNYGDHSLGESYRSSAGYAQELDYFPAPPTGKSLARFPDGSSTWFLFGEATPGESNLVDNDIPHAVITLQGTKKTEGCDSLSVNVTGDDSTDPDGDSLSYSWAYRETSSKTLLHQTDRSNPLSFRFERSMGTSFHIHLKVSDPFGGSHEAVLPMYLNHCKASQSPLDEQLQTSSFQLSTNIIINELLPNPSGKDSGNEFVELYNNGPTPVRLDGWKLGSKTKKKLDGQILHPFDFLIFKKITLRNTGDTIQLLDPNEKVQSETTYLEAKDNASWSRDEKGLFRWTIPTEGRKNDFPFQTETIYLQATAPLIITRFLPNPKGKDDGNEWIEIMNRSQNVFDLSAWQLDNREGGSKPYLLSGTLQPGQTRQYISSESQVILRNTSDQVRILDPSGQVMDLLEWKSPAPDGKVFERNQLVRDLNIEPDLAQVVTVVDGDTIDVEIDGVRERVRLIGVDTPETVHPFKELEYYGKEASAFTKNMLEGKTVRLEYDLNKRGKYGRLLAYVWLDDLHFNAELVRQGYAFAYLKYPFKYREAFRKLEQEAQEQGRGLWQSEHSDTLREEQDQVIDEELEELQSIEEALEELDEEERQEEEKRDVSPAGQKAFAGVAYHSENWDKILLNEILPNPLGRDSDGGEFIELKVGDGVNVNLAGWTIQNNKGKTIWNVDEGFKNGVERAYEHSLSETFILLHPSSSIKNTQETLSLIDPFGQVRDQFSYDQSMKEGQVWARHPQSQEWFLWIQATPAAANPENMTSALPRQVRKGKEKRLKPLYLIQERQAAWDWRKALFQFLPKQKTGTHNNTHLPLQIGAFLVFLAAGGLLKKHTEAVKKSSCRRLPAEPATGG